MDRAREQFRRRLLESEPITAELEERYQRKVRMLFERNLTTLQRRAVMALVGVLLAQTAFFGYLLLTSGRMAPLPRLGLAMGGLFSACFIAFLMRVLRRGSYRLRGDANLYTGLIWAFLVIMITLFMLVAGGMQDTVRAVSLVLNGLVFVVLGVVFILQNTINQAQLKTQEKLLEIELQLAELKEMLQKE